MKNAHTGGGGRGSKNTVFMVLLLLSGLFLIFSFMINTRLRPILEDLAIAKVTNLSHQAINLAVEEEIANGNIQYDNLIHFEKDVNGNITALKTDMMEVNRMKTQLLTKIIDNISQIQTSELKIPIGNIFNSNFFSGRGPKLHIKVTSVSFANASFANVFTEAGINQTKHQIMMSLDISVSIMLPTANTDTNIHSELCVAETVIVGKVPESYTFFSGVEDVEDAMDKYYNYQ